MKRYSSARLPLGSVNRKPFRTRSSPSRSLFSAPLSSAGEHKVHSSMRLGISQARMTEPVCERNNQPAVEIRLRSIAACR
jgi:hypothetical protein